VVYRESDQRCLLLKRHPREVVYSGKYCVPGGKLEWLGMDLSQPTMADGDVLKFENAIEGLLAKEVINSISWLRQLSNICLGLPFQAKADIRTFVSKTTFLPISLPLLHPWQLRCFF